MTIASDLLQRHIQTLVDDNAQWQTLIADDVLWELAYAPSIGHPAQLSGREEAVRHAIWFVGAVENCGIKELRRNPSKRKQNPFLPTTHTVRRFPRHERYSQACSVDATSQSVART